MLQNAKLLFSSMGKFIYPDSPTEIERKYITENNFLETEHKSGRLNFEAYGHYLDVKNAYWRYRSQIDFMMRDRLCIDNGALDRFQEGALTLDQLVDPEHDILKGALNEGFAEWHELDRLYSTHDDYIELCKTVKNLRQYQQAKEAQGIDSTVMDTTNTVQNQFSSTHSRSL